MQDALGASKRVPPSQQYFSEMNLQPSFEENIIHTPSSLRQRALIYNFKTRTLHNSTTTKGIY